MNNTIKLFALVIICTTLMSACDQKPKSYKEIQEEIMKGKTDQDLIQEIYGKPMNYKIVRITTPRGITDNNPGGLGLKQGGVLQVMFYEGKVFVEKFGDFSGSYEKKYFSNAEGSIKITFQGEGNTNDYTWTGGSRINPQWISNAITVTQSYQAESEYGVHNLQISYVLRRM